MMNLIAVTGKDYTGMKFGHWTVLRPYEKNKRGRLLWMCQCVCGNTFPRLPYDLGEGKSNSCGCRKQRNVMIGRKFGKLTVTERAHKIDTLQYWHVLCDCGNKRTVSASGLYGGTTKSCGCSRHKVDLTGQRFGQLKVIKYAQYAMNNQRMWTCECDCGNIKDIRQYNLIRGTTKSCGKQKCKERTANGNTNQ